MLCGILRPLERSPTLSFNPARGFAVFAAHGLAPFLYEVDADAFMSEDGDVSARIEVEYPILITQRLVLQPALELDFAVQEVEEVGIGPGLSQVELGLRLRYEIVRELAPYVGFVWERKVGRTADLARRRGEDFDTPAFGGRGAVLVLAVGGICCSAP